MYKLVTLFACIFSIASAQNPCLGEYELCPKTGDCVLITGDCGKCGAGQYLCPDRKTCVANAKAYVLCPVAGTHYDWTLDIETRIHFLITATSLAERVSQLQNDAPESNNFFSHTLINFNLKKISC